MIAWVIFVVSTTVLGLVFWSMGFSVFLATILGIVVACAFSLLGEVLHALLVKRGRR